MNNTVIQKEEYLVHAFLFLIIKLLKRSTGTRVARL